MKQEEKQNALMDAIGDINDRILQESMTYQRKQKFASRQGYLRIAACLAVCFVLAIAVYLLPKWNAGLESPAPDAPPQDNSPSGGDSSIAPPDGASPPEGQASLLSLLTQASGTARQVSSPENLPFFDGNAYLVWQLESGGAYYISDAISQNNLQTLLDTLSDGQRIDRDTAQPAFRLWLLRADGSVITPHLPDTDGNTYWGNLFDYHAELIPSATFTDKLSDLLF